MPKRNKINVSRGLKPPVMQREAKNKTIGSQKIGTMYQVLLLKYSKKSLSKSRNGRSVGVKIHCYKKGVKK